MDPKQKEIKLRKMFSDYIKGASVAFGHQKKLTDGERLEIYYQAFASVVGPHLENKI